MEVEWWGPARRAVGSFLDIERRFLVVLVCCQRNVSRAHIIRRRVFLKRLRSSNELMQMPPIDGQTIPGHGGEVRGRLQGQAPHMLASCCHLSDFGARPVFFIREVRQTQRQVQLQGQQLTQYATRENTKEERRMKRTMSAVATMVKDKLVETHLDRLKKSYLLVCWRSTTLVIAHQRLCPVQPDGSISWYDTWRVDDRFDVAAAHAGRCRAVGRARINLAGSGRATSPQKNSGSRSAGPKRYACMDMPQEPTGCPRPRPDGHGRDCLARALAPEGRQNADAAAPRAYPRSPLDSCGRVATEASQW